jgi:hypothetical protein
VLPPGRSTTAACCQFLTGARRTPPSGERGMVAIPSASCATNSRRSRASGRADRRRPPTRCP